ncbi:YL1 nuclear protein-domain-containing protein [Scheffersomyces xylosifermentans]|uniref:YL1 nuclear protein-domain-containing protein n=1 Tax=Scheffersomyces xylosifermentans TaxID=1304137 RepID=UPI00315D67D3
MDPDSLVATRQRRSNAGSRMKQLIELEEQSVELQSSISQFVTEDDENVNLLFQEDGNDEEFIDEDVDNDNLRGIDEVDEDEDDGDDEDVDQSKRSKRKHGDVEDDDNEDENGVKSDEMLSDSDISLSEDDESEGEKDLQAQEKLKKRRIKKKQSLVPTIKKAQPKEPKSKKLKKTNLVTSASLLLSERRSSSRAAVVENKAALVKRLKASEERRAKIAPVVRVEVKELTQEDRLAEAIETEKSNIESLNKFRQQEVVKKERQRQLLLSKRVKLTNVIRLVSKDTYITPYEEVKEARRLFELQTRRKRRPGRKKKFPTDEPQIKIRIPGEIDVDLPYYIKEKEEEERLKKENGKGDGTIEIKKEESESVGEVSKGDSVPSEDLEVQNEERVYNEEHTKKPIGEVDSERLGSKQELDLSEAEENKLDAEKNEVSKSEDDSKTSNEGVSLESDNNNVSRGKTESITIVEEVNVIKNGGVSHVINGESPPEVSNSATTVKKETTEITETKETTQSKDDVVDNEDSMEVDQQNETSVVINNDLEKENDSSTGGDTKPIEESAAKIEEEEKDEKVEKKKVTFADDVAEEEDVNAQESREGTPNVDLDSKEGTPIPENGEAETGEIFEGPPQRVSRNTVYLIDFNEEYKDFKLTTQNIKSFLFGPQSLLPASRRFKDLETLLHIGKVDNPYAVVKPEKDILFEPASDLKEDDPIFDELKKLPRLGVKQAEVEEIKEDVETESAAIILKTEAPTGLYLPNGNKKNCLISGTEVKYFDPANGIPYSSVETYKLLKSIEQGLIPWYSIGADQNDTGPVEIYLGSRDGSIRPAKGVPDGFDG